MLHPRCEPREPDPGALSTVCVPGVHGTAGSGLGPLADVHLALLLPY